MAKVKNRMKLKGVEMALGSPPLSVMNHNTCFKDAIEQFIRFQEGKGNTEQTILYYKRKLKKLWPFAATNMALLALLILKQIMKLVKTCKFAL